MRRIGAVALVSAVAFAALGTVFMVGMRRQIAARPQRGPSQRPRDAAVPPEVERNPGAVASIVRHVGRKSGQTYETPVNAVATDDGFVIALPYGLNTDWLKNVLASGSATIVDEGKTYLVDHPEVVPLSVAEPLFSPKDQHTRRGVRVDDYLLLQVRRMTPRYPRV